ncbi:helix-turn-helix domain-containing protein [Selenihalanaerobacter shriftii]|uniref:Protein RodZ, contains Xre-like HTH and DUF4115 domains n=1 Tax=Selenihalanaerobacter shriftii TaxID=142842 RepID=A0A1T4JMT9_9FIRM|nr:RodZ domain-containing protein [Selenihalanaerobacter shriftii]SJZ31502.1 protein RodZ, contains Xre-like HTH and DUF4115 domains [Selenihalanaerobacter shriftii]
MKEIGQKIKEARLAKEIDIEEVQQETKVRSKYLKAIEEGNFNIIPQEVFLKGFLRVYANHVGLDGSQILKDYNHLKALQKKELDKLNEEENQKISLMEKVQNRVKNNWTRVVTATAITVLVLLIVFGLYRSRALVKLAKEVRKINENPVKKEKLVLNEEDVKVKKDKISSAQKETNSNETNQINQSQSLAQKLNVTIEALESSWVKVVIDGKVVCEKILNSGEKKSWHADQRMKVLTANAAGVKVISNGKIFGPFGQQGEVIEKEFKLNSE